MDLNALLARTAVRRAGVLVVEAPGAALTRYAAERLVAARGWRPALSPADADVLLTCGEPGPRLAAVLDLVWAQLPGPRARAGATTPGEVGEALDRAARDLLDDDGQRAQAAVRPTEPVPGGLAEEPDDEGHDGEGHDGEGHGEEHDEEPDAGEDHEDDTHGDMDHGDMDHGGMDHGDMEMAPHGIPLAGGAQDRDGLEMDVLHLTLGPVLPGWPAGLLLHCTLAGDVVTELRPEVLDDPAGGSAAPLPAAAALDRAARVLALAGRPGWAARARQFRDAVQAGDPAPELDRLREQVRGSRLLRWSLGDVGRIDAATCREHGLDGRLAGTVHDRLVASLDEARPALGGPDARPATVPLAVLPRILSGAELGAVRLVVAGLDLDLPVRRTAAA